MARLGRGRRKPAKLVRSSGAVTPTLLVRKRSIVHPDSRAVQFIARLGRSRRKGAFVSRSHPVTPPATSSATIIIKRQTRKAGQRGVRLSHAPSLVTPTPLVRRRVKVSTDSRAALAARLRRHVRIVRARIAVPTPVRHTPVVKPDTRVQRIARTRHLGARVTHAPSTPTATPLVRKRLVLETDAAAARLARLGRVRRKGATVVRAPSTTTPTPLVRRRLVLELDTAPSRLAHLGRARRKGATVSRALSSPTPTPSRQRAVVHSARRPIRVRHHQARLARPLVVIRPLSVRHTPVVSHRSRGAYVRKHRAYLSRSGVVVITGTGWGLEPWGGFPWGDPSGVTSVPLRLLLGLGA